MWSQILVVLAVVALFVWWLRTPRGREALALVGSAPTVLVVALLLWGLVWVLGEADLGPLDEPLFSVPTMGLYVTTSLLIQVAAHLVASALVVASLARAAGARAARWTQLFPGLALGQVGIWIPMFVLIRLLAEVEIQSLAGFLVIVALMSLVLVLLNVCLARLVARLVRSEGKLAPAFARVWRRDPAGDAPALCLVLIRFLMTGAITVIVLIGHTTHEEGNTTTRTVFRANVDVQTVATVTTENPWPWKIAASIHDEPPKALVRGAGLLAAFVSLVFLAAFVRGTRRPEEKWPF